MHGSSFLQVYVFLAGLLSGRGLAEHSPFLDPDCAVTQDCSWTYFNRETLTSETQFCKILPGSQTGLEDICYNPFPPPINIHQRPGRPENIQLSDYQKNFSFVDGSRETGKYTCLRIQYNLIRYAADQVKGLQLSVRGLSQEDLNKKYCINLNFSDSGINYYAVVDKVDKDKPLNLTSSCFCGLRPGREYSVTVRTMPVDKINNSTHNPEKKLEYITTGCNDNSKEDDVRCWKSKEAQWEPQCLSVRQDISTTDHEGSYSTVEVSFDLAPEEYFFDFYEVNIKDEDGSVVDAAQIQTDSVSIVNKSCSAQNTSSLQFVTVTFNITKAYNDQPWPASPASTEYFAEIYPFPTTINKCTNEDHREIDCKHSYSWFTVIANPCQNNPCEYGQCRSLGSIYSCACMSGYIAWHGKCIADPCSRNPQTNKTVCGAHAQCEQTIFEERVGHKCTCDPGYRSYDGICRDVVKPIWWVVVVVGSCFIGLLLFVLLLCIATKSGFFKRILQRIRGLDSTVVTQEENWDKDALPVGGLVHRILILLIFTKDHLKHMDVVGNFASFLERHFYCTVWRRITASNDIEQADIEQADIVLLLCSKGMGLTYEAQDPRVCIPYISSTGYSDILDPYLAKDEAKDKFVVAYFDYSNIDDIPVAFRDFEPYRLMESIELLYQHIHGRIPGSSQFTQGDPNLLDYMYHDLEAERPLCQAIMAMKDLIQSDNLWYENYQRHISGASGYSSCFEENKNRNHLPRVPSVFFGSTPSGLGCSDDEYEEMMKAFNNSSVASHECGVPSLPELQPLCQARQNNDQSLNELTPVFTYDPREKNADSGFAKSYSSEASHECGVPPLPELQPLCQARQNNDQSLTQLTPVFTYDSRENNADSGFAESSFF